MNAVISAGSRFRSRWVRQSSGAVLAVVISTAAGVSAAAGPPPNRLEKNSNRPEPSGPRGRDVGARIVIVHPDLTESDLDERSVALISAHGAWRGANLQFQRRERPAGVQPLIVEATKIAMQEQALGVVWVDLSGTDELKIYLYLADKELFFGRRIPVEGSEAVAVETLANVAGSAIAALLEGGNLGISAIETVGLARERVSAGETRRVDLTARLTEAERANLRRRQARPDIRLTAVVVPRMWPRLRLRAQYVGTNFAEEVPWQSGASMALGVYVIDGLHLELGYALMTPILVEDDLEAFRVQRHPLEVGFGYRLPIGSVFGVVWGARVSLDPVVRSSIPDAKHKKFDSTVRLFSHVGLKIGVGAKVAPTMFMLLTAGLDLGLTRAEYTRYTPEREVLLNPDLFRFVVGLGVVFDLVER